MRVVTILGPSQSGKSTLAEALAGLEGRLCSIVAADKAEAPSLLQELSWGFLHSSGARRSHRNKCRKRRDSVPSREQQAL